MARELDIGKKDIASDLVKKARKPGLNNDIQNMLNSLRGDSFLNNDNNNNFSPPPSSPPTFNNFISPPQPPPPPPLTFNNFNLPPLPPLPTFNQPSPPTFNNVFSQLPKERSTFQPQHPLEAILTRTKPEPEKVIENIDTEIYKLLDPLKIEIGDSLLNILSTDAEDILKDDYVNDKVWEDKTMEQIKDEYNFDDIKDAFDDGQVPTPA